MFFFLVMSDGSQFWLHSRPVTTSLVGAMSGVVYSAPPAQITLTISFSDDTAPSVERIFRWLDLEGRLCIDPNKILLPTSAPAEDQSDPELDDLHLHVVEWTSMFPEGGTIIVYVIESLFPDIARHCALCYPVNIVQCKGSGRVVISTLVLRPISGTSVVYSMHRLHSKLHDATLEIGKLHRQMDMLIENHKAMARCLLTSTPALIAYLHPDTPATWFEGLPEEF